MPKSSLKQNNRKNVISFVNSSADASNTKLCNKINISRNKVFTNNIKPPFPPTLTINDLIKNTITSNKPKTFPNAFIAYRMALMKEYHVKNCKLPSMGEVSKIARDFWSTEPKHVKDFYESLVEDAKSTYKRNNIQIIMDKHMDYVKNYQESFATFDAEKQLEIRNENHDSVTGAENNNDSSFPTTDVSLVNSSVNYDASINDREYIGVLEQLIDHLLRNH